MIYIRQDYTAVRGGVFYYATPLPEFPETEAGRRKLALYCERLGLDPKMFSNAGNGLEIATTRLSRGGKFDTGPIPASIKAETAVKKILAKKLAEKLYLKEQEEIASLREGLTEQGSQPGEE